ncbi:MAG TPA: MarR family transcriptional regulator [Baekduia sp.]
MVPSSDTADPPALDTTTDAELDAVLVAFDAFAKAAKRARARWEPDASLTAAQVDLLSPLLECAPAGLGLRELARLVGIAAPTATRMLDGLETRGFVTRARDPEDGRAVRIALTAEGRDALLARRAQMLARRRAMLDQLTPSERRAAARVLARLASAFEKS